MLSSGSNAGLIRKLHSFPADVLPSDYCSRYNTDLPLSLLSITSYAFIFSLIAPSFRSTASFLPTPHFPVKFHRCSFKSTRLSEKYHIFSSLSLSIILHKSFINMVYTPLNFPSPILPSFIVLLTLLYYITSFYA